MWSKVAVAVVVSIGVGTAATLLVRDARARQEQQERERALHAQLIEHLDRLDRSLALMGGSALAVAARGVHSGAAPAACPPDVAPGRAVALVEAAAASTDVPPPRPPLSPDQEMHLVSGNQIVDRALVAARWSDEDRDAFNLATVSLPGEQRAELMARVAAAINHDQIRVDTTHAPF